MKKKFPIVFWSLLVLAFLTACGAQTGAASPTLPAAAASEIPVPATFSDPFAYCAAAGTIDAPDSRYTGEKTPDVVIQGFLKAAGLENTSEPAEMLQKSTIWRCMDGKVYACNFGANLPCDSKANTDKTPTQEMTGYCKENQGAEFIPAYVTGHTTIYSWRCDKDKPVVDQQVFQTDAAGYLSEIWYPISPPS